MTIVERVSSERLVVLGWSRAILLQIAHPLIAEGVIEHSSFRGGVIEAAVRLHHTISAMLSLTFGDTARRTEAVARIRAIHRTVNGTLPVDAGPFTAGTPYSAEDPALLLWVHATLIDSTADIYQRLIAPLSDADRDGLCVQSAPLLEELGGDPRTTPRTWCDLQRYLARVYDSGALSPSAASRTLAEAVLSPRAAGVPVPIGGLHRLVAIGLLPPAVRAAYGFDWNATRERRFRRALRVIRNARRVTPRLVALWPEARRPPAASA
jgi:uncharacterized protein (DUF2236 family)